MKKYYAYLQHKFLTEEDVQQSASASAIMFFQEASNKKEYFSQNAGDEADPGLLPTEIQKPSDEANPESAEKAKRETFNFYNQRAFGDVNPLALAVMDLRNCNAEAGYLDQVANDYARKRPSSSCSLNSSHSSKVVSYDHDLMLIQEFDDTSTTPIEQGPLELHATESCGVEGNRSDFEEQLASGFKLYQQRKNVRANNNKANFEGPQLSPPVKLGSFGVLGP